jgi:hypothetical protein
MTPYRTNQHKEGEESGPWLLLWCCKHFKWARRRMGGHWERHWLPPGPHASVSDYGEWGPWNQVVKCTEKYPGEYTRYDTAGCPIYDQCENYN